MADEEMDADNIELLLDPDGGPDDEIDPEWDPEVIEYARANSWWDRHIAGWTSEQRDEYYETGREPVEVIETAGRNGEPPEVFFRWEGLEGAEGRYLTTTVAGSEAWGIVDLASGRVVSPEPLGRAVESVRPQSWAEGGESPPDTPPPRADERMWSVTPLADMADDSGVRIGRSDEDGFWVVRSPDVSSSWT